MAISRSSTETGINEDQPTGPGRRLRDARIARNLELEQVAARLHLHLNTIERIEADDYDALPAPTFVRGYLRGYARMLDIAPDKILGAYNSHEFDPPPLVRDISNTEEVRSTDVSFRLATYLILAVVVILVALWWQNQNTGNSRTSATDTVTSIFETLTETSSGTQEMEEDALVSEDTEAGDESSAATFSALNAQTSEAPEQDQDSETTTDTVHVGTTTPDEETTEAIDSTMDTDTLDTSETQSEPSLQSAIEAPALTETTESDVDVAAETDTTSVAQPTASTNTLRIEVGAETWMEIYDGDNKKLYYDLARAGKTVEISEAGPMRVLLGNTTDVTIEYNGIRFDLVPYTVAGIARFRVPAENQNQSQEAVEQ